MSFKWTVAQVKAMDLLSAVATYIAFGGGSRSGKTYLLVFAVVTRALKAPGSRHAILRYRFNAIKSAIIYDTLPKVLTQNYPMLPSSDSMLNKTDWFLKLPNGSEIWFGGLDDKERVEKILGNEYVTIYYNECSQIPWPSIVLSLTRLAQKVDPIYDDNGIQTSPGLELKAYYDFNPPSKKHWTYVTFVEKRDYETKRPLPDEMDYAFYLINPMDNKENLPAKYLTMLERMPERARNRFLFGRFADDSDGALWTEQLLAVCRKTDELPEYLRIVIAVDPSGSDGDESTRSDDIGIGAVALGTDGHAYVLEDLTINAKPEAWADIVNEAYDRLRADMVVGEANFGGDMVRAVLQAKNPNLPYKHVTASRGKVQRAEPIAALYDLGKVHHVGYFPELEDEMCAFTTAGYQGLRSPNRADWLVWALTELFPGLTQKAIDANWRPPGVVSRKRSASRYENQLRR